jgi:hypothetical protein
MLLTAVLLVAAGIVWSDIPAPRINIVRQGGDPSESIAHISGFSKYPDRVFWLVEKYQYPETAKWFALLQKIDTDSISVDAKRYSRDPGIEAEKFISWDPELSKLESGWEYSLAEVAMRFPPRDTGRINYGAGETPAVSILARHYVGFMELHHYYTIHLYEHWQNRGTPNATPEFVLSQTSEIWMHPHFTITNTDPWKNREDVWRFLENRTKADIPPEKQNTTSDNAGDYRIAQQVPSIYNPYDDRNISWEMDQDDLDALLAYVPKLPNHVLELKDSSVHPTVYVHDSRSYIPQRYTLPAVVPLSYRFLTISMSILACLGVAILLVRVLLKKP